MQASIALFTPLDQLQVQYLKDYGVVYLKMPSYQQATHDSRLAVNRILAHQTNLQQYLLDMIS